MVQNMSGFNLIPDEQEIDNEARRYASAELINRHFQEFEALRLIRNRELRERIIATAQEIMKQQELLRGQND
jgi:hypothetical protein